MRKTIGPEILNQKKDTPTKKNFCAKGNATPPTGAKERRTPRNHRGRSPQTACRSPSPSLRRAGAPPRSARRRAPTAPSWLPRRYSVSVVSVRDAASCATGAAPSGPAARATRWGGGGRSPGLCCRAVPRGHHLLLFRGSASRGPFPAQKTVASHTP